MYFNQKKNKINAIGLMSFSFLFFFIFAGTSYGNNKSGFMTEKLVPVATQTPDIHIYPFSIKTSSDGKHIAYVSNNKKTKKMSACLDGNCGKLWDKISEDSPILSSDGNRMAYIAHDGDYVRLVLDGKPGKEFKTINAVRFSNNDQHLLYWAEKSGKVFIVLDNSKTIMVDEILDLSFSPDSKQIGFSAKVSDKWYAFRNGKRGPGFDRVIDVKFSPDSKHFAYLANDGVLWNAIVDGKKKGFWGARMGNLVFSPDSLKIAYGYYRYDDMEKNKKQWTGAWRMVVNEVAGPKISEKYNLFLFSPDSKRYAYVAGYLGKQFIYMGSEQKKSDEYMTIKHIKFSPDSKHFVHIPIDSDGQYAVIMDGKKHKSYEFISEPQFSGNSSIFSYIAIEEKGSGERIMVINGKEEGVYNKIGLPFFSSDGKRYAYAALDDDEWMMVLDGKKQKPYERVGIASFDKDNNHLAYTAFKSDKWVLVVDGHEGQVKFDSRKFPHSYLYSYAPGCFRLLVANRKGKNINFYNLEVKVN